MSKPRRKFSPEFRRIAVERMLEGENISQMARDLDVLRKTLYEWKDAYIAELPGGWVKKIPVRVALPEGAKKGPEPAELLVLSQARKRIAELERKIGRQELELDFFGGALQRIAEVKAKSSAKLSTTSSPIDPSKAN